MVDVFVPDHNKLTYATNFATGTNVVLESSRLHVAWIAAGTAAVDSSVRCPLDVAAFAAVCCLDQWDRPIGGVIWLCPRLLGLMATKVDGQSEDDLFRFTSHVLAHEFAHILGFDEQLFDLFRWADGTPRVSRNARGVPTGSLVSVC